LALFLTYFLALTQARSLMESGSGVGAILATHFIFTLVALVLLYWESISQSLSGRSNGSL
jgi:lipopolysaccharide export system permease protein